MLGAKNPETSTPCMGKLEFLLPRFSNKNSEQVTFVLKTNVTIGNFFPNCLSNDLNSITRNCNREAIFNRLGRC